SAKAEPSVHKDPLFDELDDDEIDNMDIKDAQDVGRSRDVVNEEKENADLFHLYELMMEQYSEITLEGFELILWGDLKIMMESLATKENDQNGIVIHMLVERRYPLLKDLLQRMLDLGLEVERESTVALDLRRFIKK
ncbi:hypothetical protein Tco_0346972, partial [Tanacetum coccineum]